MNDDQSQIQPTQNDELSGLQDVPESHPDTPTSDVSQQNGADILLNLESLIRQHASTIKARREELKKFKDMLGSVLANDETYSAHDDKVKEATKTRTATKQQILKLPQNAELSKKVQSLGAEVKELEGALSDYLREYGRMSGSNEIEDETGEPMEIVYIAKLIRHAKRHD